MTILYKRKMSLGQSLSGPAELVARKLKADKGMRVLAFELAEGQRHLESALAKACEMLWLILSKRRREMDDEKLERLSECLIEGIDLERSAIVERVMHASAIEHLLGEGKWLAAADVAKLGRYSQSNPSEPANRWKKEGRIFAVMVGNQTLYPAYQFDDQAKPLPIVRDVLRLFQDKRSPLQTAGWFATPNSWLRGKRPQVCLKDPGRVIEAARRELVAADG